MSDVNYSSDHQAPLVTPDVGEIPDKISVSDAARLLQQSRRPKAEAAPPKPVEAAPEPTPPPVKQSEAPPAEDASPPEAVPGEQQGDDQAQLPSIDPPRSWSKEDKELFTGLPRETQERLAERERSREGDFLRRQNEVSERQKAAEAERQKTEQVRQQYETALPILLQNLQSGMSGEFADIKTMADVQKMATEDWPRYIRWDAQQKQVYAVQEEMRTAEQRRQQEKQGKWQEFSVKEDELFKAKAPEWSNAEEASRLQSAAIKTLNELGFTESELAESWNGSKDLSLRDHRMQLLIRDAVKWREAQAKARVAPKAPLPPVQRPGPSQPKNADLMSQVQTSLENLPSMNTLDATREGARLLRLRRENGGRR